MSYTLLKSELKLKLYRQHDSRTKFASTLATAYDKFVNRHFEVISGGGKPVATSAKIPILQAGFQLILSMNLIKENRINFFNQIEPYIKAYWMGQVITGPAGIVVITNPGVFKGPPIVENNSIDIFLNILQGCIAVHMLTMTGVYTNYYTGITVPWSSALLKTIP